MCGFWCFRWWNRSSNKINRCTLKKKRIFFSIDEFKKEIFTPFVKTGGSSTDFDRADSSVSVTSPFSSFVLLVVRTTTIRVLGVTSVRAIRLCDGSVIEDVLGGDGGGGGGGVAVLNDFFELDRYLD